MADPFIGEIRIFAGTFAPRGWAFCDGQTLPIAQYTALFSILGTTYGGDGRSTLGLPDLRGRCPMHPGRGPGLTPRRLGERGGERMVRLTENQMSAHNHAFRATTAPATETAPGGKLPATTEDDTYASQGTRAGMAGGVLGSTGGGQPHNNMQPYLAVHFIIALEGLFPSRS